MSQTGWALLITCAIIMQIFMEGFKLKWVIMTKFGNVTRLKTRIDKNGFSKLLEKAEDGI